MQKKVDKEDWIGMFRDIGISDEARMNWHHLFETRHPEGHQDFLVCGTGRNLLFRTYQIGVQKIIRTNLLY